MNAMVRTIGIATAWLVGLGAVTLGNEAQAARPDAARVFQLWTPERIRDAIPRDLVIDQRGYGYLKGKDGKLTPYGHSMQPMGKPTKPGGGGTTTVPGTIGDANWPYGGAVQTAAGRILFSMPNDTGAWVYYVCSGTVISEPATDRSIIITAAHCVYNDVAKVFAKDVMFIPNQVGLGRDTTDTNCLNDPLGCWVPSFGVVDVGWTAAVFPNNVEWDYAYYVVEGSGAHQGTAAPASLEVAAGTLPVSFDAPIVDVAGATDYTTALGYSYKWDPKFRYCAEEMTTKDLVNWWLASCKLTGGSSGGPWVQPMNNATGSGPIISVNSWGYTSGAGMAGPKLVGTSAEAVLDIAVCADIAFVKDPANDVNGDGIGVVVDASTVCPYPPPPPVVEPLP